MTTIVRVADAWLPRRQESGSRARCLLRGFLAEVDNGELFAEGGAMVLTELVTNAVQHAQAPRDRRIFVRLEMSPGLLRIEVHDPSRQLPVMRKAKSDDESGRGLWLVEQLSQEWGADFREGGVGKLVWALLTPVIGGAG